MFEFTKHLDILSSNIRFFLNGHKSLKTKFGGFLSFSIIILGLVGFFFYLSKIIDRSEPTVSMNKIYTPESIYYLNTTESVFAFRLADRLGNVINDTYYTPIAQHWKYFYVKDDKGNMKMNFNFTNLKFSKCESLNLNTPEFNEVYQKKDLSRHWCLNPGQIIEIKNPFGGNSDYSYINIYFTHCTHLGAQCEKRDKIDNFLTSYIAELFFKSYYVDNFNYQEPLQPYIYTFNEFSSSAFFKRIFYEIKTLEHFSDDGLVVPDEKTRSKFSVENLKSIFDYRNTDMNGGKLLFQFTYTFNTNGFKETYYRSYKKIQNLLAEIGGFLNFIKLVCLGFMLIYTEVIYVPLVYEGYSFYLDENVSKNNHSSIQIFNKNLTSNNPNIENFRNSNNNSPMTKLSRIPQHFISKKNDVVPEVKKKSLPSNYEIFKNYFKCGQNKSLDYKIFLEAKKKLISIYLNVSSLIGLRNELNLIKLMLLKSKKDENMFRSAVNIVRLSENENFENNYSNYYGQIVNETELGQDNINLQTNIHKYLKYS